MRIARMVGLAAGAGAMVFAAAQAASALPAAGAAQAAHVAKTAEAGAGLVGKVEFKRRPDGSMYYVRPLQNGEQTHYFAYRGYAYPYNPGYTYRLSRGELRPSDRPRRYRIVD
jgi:hypothetical protein